MSVTNKDLTRFAWLSVATAIATISLKTLAYLMTGSVGLLSDALESVINLVAAAFALWMLKIAARPADEDHPFGHYKAEYFAGALEGTLIGMAALSIIWVAVNRLIAPQPIEQIGIGLIITTAASLLNLVVGQLLIRTGRKHRSITLEADGKHLMTDVWTSASVIIALIVVNITGWYVLDPIIALFVAVNILRTGYNVVKRSTLGLMDTVISDEDMKAVVNVLDSYVEKEKIDYHALRTRESGSRVFISVHILMPDEWSIREGHKLIDKIEDDIRTAVAGAIVFTHMEPISDPASMADIDLE
ncbi:MAG: cation transporter [Acidobacteria bacterium]|nr:cation transporter [Acidobacteriota bacterium]